jgi:uncharacterized protein (DUF4415 family)
MSTKLGKADTKNSGRTDWAKLAAMPDSAVQFSNDAPATTADDWAKAVAHKGLPMPVKKEQIALRVDSDVISWFRAQGAGWQTRMNAVLRSYRYTLAS